MLSPTRKPIRNSAATSSQLARQTGPDALTLPAKSDPKRPPQQVQQHGVLQRNRHAYLGPVEEVVRDAESEQHQQVQRRHPPRPPPVEQADQEQRTQRQEHVGRIQLVTERARVPSCHLPQHLVPGPRLGDLPTPRVDEHQRHLFVAGEVGDLPVPFDLRGAVRKPPVLPPLLDHLRVAIGNPDRLVPSNLSLPLACAATGAKRVASAQPRERWRRRGLVCQLRSASRSGSAE